MLGVHGMQSISSVSITEDYTFFSGKISPSEVMELMRKCNPPVGWGKLCPQTVAYKVKMNTSNTLLTITM